MNKITKIENLIRDIKIFKRTLELIDSRSVKLEIIDTFHNYPLTENEIYKEILKSYQPKIIEDIRKKLHEMEKELETLIK